MKILAWIVLSAIILILVGLAYYLLVGALLYKLVFARRNVATRYLNRDTQERLKKYKIDLSWWDEVDFETVKIQSIDNLTLYGHFHLTNSRKTAIIFHGFGSSYREMQQYAKFFYEKNFSVLVVDMRSHGDSEGNCVGYGWLEKDDVASWASYVANRCPDDKIVLFGLSMGASAVCMSSSQEMKNVEAIISDCAFANANRQIEHVMRDHKFLLKLMKRHVYSYTKRLHDFDIMQADALSQVSKSRYPILFIHGEKDDFVAFENMDILFNATEKGKREKFVAAGASHAMSYAVTGKVYEKKITEFLSKYASL